MAQGSSEKKISNCLGLNALAAVDRVDDKEFTKLQNVYQASKGVFQRRFGSVLDQGSFPLASRISGVWRHYAASGDKFSFYHCVPDTTPFPDNTIDLILTDIPNSNGNIFGGGAVTALRVCYSWIGCGIEQTYNSKNRAGFPGSFPVNAWLNPAHQTITLSGTLSTLQVTVPVFPAGVRGANIFVSRGTSTQMTYMGTVTTSGGSLIVSEFIGPNAAANDTITLGDPSPSGVFGGNLLPGSYYVACAWVCDPLAKEGINGTGAGTFGTPMPLSGGTGQTTQPSLNVTAASSSTAGSLANSTEYDYVISVVDAVSNQETFVSTVQNVTTGAGATSVDITLPSLPPAAPAGSTFNIYFGTHGGTPYFVKDGALQGEVFNQGAVPASGVVAPAANNPSFTYSTQVTLSGTQSGIQLTAPTSNSTNGAQALYVFLGTQPGNVHSMVCVGMMRVGGFIDIYSIPSHNAQSTPTLYFADKNSPVFMNQVNDQYIGGIETGIGKRFDSRFGFILSQQNSLPLSELFPARTLVYETFKFLTTAVYAGDNPSTTFNDLHNFAAQPKTQNDTYHVTNPYPWGYPVNDPNFCYLSGMSYFANGVDIPWQTDGFTLCQLSCVQATNGTQLPPIPKFIFPYNGSLVIAGAQAKNQIYASNAHAPQNWATGGDGQLQRFVTIGDPTGTGVTAMGVFTPATEATSNPNSFIISFKKNGCWMIPNISDPQVSTLVGNLLGQAPSPMTQISGKTGTVAYRTICQTPMGTMFLANDGNVYVINAVSEPRRLGTKIQPLLTHLLKNDAWMQSVTAVYHDNHYKISYPSPNAVLLPVVSNDSQLWADLRTEEGPITWNGPHMGVNIGPQVVFSGESDDESRLAADSSTVRTMKVDNTSTLQDLGVNIVVQIRSKNFRFGADSHVKRMYGAILDVFLDMSYSNTILFEGFADEYYQSVNRKISDGGAVWDQSQWDQGNYSDAMYFGLDFLFGEANLNGRVMQFQITNADNAPFVLGGVTLLLKNEKRRVLR